MFEVSSQRTCKTSSWTGHKWSNCNMKICLDFSTVHCTLINFSYGFFIHKKKKWHAFCYAIFQVKWIMHTLGRTLKWMLSLFPLRQGPKEGRKSLARQECLECPCGFTCLGFVQPQFSSEDGLPNCHFCHLTGGSTMVGWMDVSGSGKRWSIACVIMASM